MLYSSSSKKRKWNGKATHKIHIRQIHLEVKVNEAHIFSITHKKKKNRKNEMKENRNLVIDLLIPIGYKKIIRTTEKNSLVLLSIFVLLSFYFMHRSGLVTSYVCSLFLPCKNFPSYFLVEFLKIPRICPSLMHGKQKRTIKFMELPWKSRTLPEMLLKSLQIACK